MYSPSGTSISCICGGISPCQSNGSRAPKASACGMPQLQIRPVGSLMYAMIWPLPLLMPPSPRSSSFPLTPASSAQIVSQSCPRIRFCFCQKSQNPMLS